MYEGYYGLCERPFDLTSNPRYLLLTAAHEEALTGLTYGLGSRAGIIVLAGEAGTGKTTVIRAALASLPEDAAIVTITNPILTPAEFQRALARGFGLSAAAETSKTVLLEELTAALRQALAADRATGLIVDEAHTATHELLEETRLLSNIETDEHKLLPVVLAGQPELTERLNRQDLRQLKQRVAVRCTLPLLTPRETAAYIAGRIAVAGGEVEGIFTPEAIALIHRAAAGVPRTINVIAANALVTGFAADVRPIGAATVAEACRDLDIGVPDDLAAPQTVGTREWFAGPAARHGSSWRTS
jgi:general secretion pathway protein A